MVQGYPSEAWLAQKRELHPFCDRPLLFNSVLLNISLHQIGADHAVGQSVLSTRAVWGMMTRKIWFISKAGSAQGHLASEVSCSSCWHHRISERNPILRLIICWTTWIAPIGLSCGLRESEWSVQNISSRNLTASEMETPAFVSFLAKAISHKDFSFSN